MKKLINYLFPLLLVSGLSGTSYSQSLTIGAISASNFCTGDSISVDFTATGFFGHNNAFTLQLSNSAGGFQSGFTNLASIQDTLPGTFKLSTVIPMATIPSSRYRLRIISAVPYTTSLDNGKDIMICIKPYVQGIEFSPRITSAGKPAYIGTDTLQGTITTWDFGPDATPSTDTGRSAQIVYLTGGDKTITITVVSICGCSASKSFKVHVFDCEPVVIHKNTQVIDHDSVSSVGFSSMWVNPGVKFELSGSYDTVFAESGSTILTHSQSSIFYLKKGAAVINQDGMRNIFILADSTSFSDNESSENDVVSCPALDFDYTNAPPNSAHPTDKVDEVILRSITLFPNPTNGLTSIQGIPSGSKELSVLNILGETMMDIKNPQSPDLTLDLSKLIPGTYYIRFSSANSVVTKIVVRQ